MRKRKYRTGPLSFSRPIDPRNLVEYRPGAIWRDSEGRLPSREKRKAELRQLLDDMGLAELPATLPWQPSESPLNHPVPFWHLVCHFGQHPDPARVHRAVTKRLYSENRYWLRLRHLGDEEYEAEWPDGTTSILEPPELDYFQHAYMAYLRIELDKIPEKDIFRNERKKAFRFLGGDQEEVWIALLWLNYGFSDDVAKARRLLVSQGFLSKAQNRRFADRWPLVQPDFWPRCDSQEPRFTKYPPLESRQLQRGALGSLLHLEWRRQVNVALVKPSPLKTALSDAGISFSENAWKDFVDGDHFRIPAARATYRLRTLTESLGPQR